MHSKTSKTRKPLSLWKVVSISAEQELPGVIEDWLTELKTPGWVLLEGPLGAGKSTFARELVLRLGTEAGTQGSPTFPLIHEYQTQAGSVLHVDLYRIKHEGELEESGILEALFETDALILIEWCSLFPDLELSLMQEAKRLKRNLWKVELSLGDSPTARTLRFFQAAN